MRISFGVGVKGKVQIVGEFEVGGGSGGARCSRTAPPAVRMMESKVVCGTPPTPQAVIGAAVAATDAEEGEDQKRGSESRKVW